MRPANVHPSQTGPCFGAYSFCMPWGLKRYYGTGSLHFITWSCYRRKPLLGDPARRDLVLTVLELMRVRYRFAVIGYVVMPEHVHLLISEPLIDDPSKIVQAVKLSVSRRLAIGGEFSGRFWQSRFYDPAFARTVPARLRARLILRQRQKIVFHRRLHPRNGRWFGPGLWPELPPGWGPGLGPGLRMRLRPSLPPLCFLAFSCHDKIVHP